ncbi:hypothetical protein CHS0354_037619 [Potamilus streckersoni]|uniref:Novel STAND NTPase 3 domain-containing protein n=1 Tax=Potamilus streckersoni TaxID=2493646 RepID=A0AAE0VJD8_9BIVA|nr:hypothetical protein CHS0354_037619 [Potamilus streckersoni]
MAGQGQGGGDVYVDIHESESLSKDGFLPQDMIENWNTIFSRKVSNTGDVVFESRAIIAAKKTLWYNGWVTIIGAPGDGKTTTTEYLLMHFAKGGEKPPGRDKEVWDRRIYKKNSVNEENRQQYTPVYINSPDEWKNKVHFDNEERQIVVIENIFGEAAYTLSTVEAWRPYLNEMMTSVTLNRPRVLLIITVNKYHLERAPEEIQQMEVFRPNVVINLNPEGSSRTRGNDKDREGILMNNAAHFYHTLSRNELSQLDFSSTYYSYPLAYRMFCQVHTFQMEGSAYLRNPWSYVSNLIEKVYRFDRIIFFTLSVGVLMDGRLELDRPTIEECEPRMLYIMKQLLTLLDCPVHVNMSKMRYAAELLTGFFLKPVKEGVFEFAHDRIIHYVAHWLFQKHCAKIIELCSIDFLIHRVRTNKYITNPNESVLYFFAMDLIALGKRFTYEILNGHVRLIAQHDALADERFVSKWFEFMKEMGTLLPVLQQRGPLGRSFFYWCCYYGRSMVVKKFLEEQDLHLVKTEEWFKHETQCGLQAACACDLDGSQEVVRCLLDLGVDKDAKDDYRGDNIIQIFGKEMYYLIKIGATPLHVAARRGHHLSVGILIEKGVDINSTLKDGCTPLHRAAMRKTGDAIKILLEKGADLNAKTERNRKPIHEAFASGTKKTIEQLIEAGADINEGMDDGRSFMCIAAQNGQRDTIDYLLSKGASVNGNDSRDVFPPLHQAIGNNNKELMEMLLDSKANINGKGCNGWTPLHLAAYLGHIDLVHHLLEKNADVNSAGYDQGTPLHLAAKGGNYQICELLLEYGAKPEKVTSSQETPVVYAARENNAAVAYLLFKEGMNLENEESRDDMDRMMRDVFHH